MERAAKSNRITVNRAARGRLWQDIAAQSGGPKQIRRGRRCSEGVTAWLMARSWGPCFPTGNAAVKEREEQHRAEGQSRSGESPQARKTAYRFARRRYSEGFAAWLMARSRGARFLTG